jgi:hypothetical protein
MGGIVMDYGTISYVALLELWVAIKLANAVSESSSKICCVDFERAE